MLQRFLQKWVALHLSLEDFIVCLQVKVWNPDGLELLRITPEDVDISTAMNIDRMKPCDRNKFVYVILLQSETLAGLCDLP